MAKEMTKDLTTGSPMKIFIMFSIPILLGNLFQQLYNMVDTIIVGQYLGEEALAAVGTTGCLMFLVLGFANGIAQGFGVMIAQAFGAGNHKQLRHFVALIVVLTILVSLILSLPTTMFSKNLLMLLYRVFSKDLYTALLIAQKAQHGPDRGGFPCSVGPEESHHFPFPNRKRDVLHATIFPIMLRQILYFNHMFHSVVLPFHLQ